MTTVPEIFGSMVFDSRVMKARLSGEVYHSLKHTIQKGAKLDLSVANAVADAMKDWAVKRRDPLHPLVPAPDRDHGGKA